MRSVDSHSSDVYALSANVLRDALRRATVEGDTQAALLPGAPHEHGPCDERARPGVKVDPAHEAIARKLSRRSRPSGTPRRRGREGPEDALEGLNPESDGIVVEHEEPASDPMTMAAQQPTSLPRFEDVAVEVDTASSTSVVQSVVLTSTQQRDRPGGRLRRANGPPGR